MCAAMADFPFLFSLLAFTSLHCYHSRAGYRHLEILPGPSPQHWCLWRLVRARFSGLVSRYGKRRSSMAAVIWRVCKASTISLQCSMLQNIPRGAGKTERPPRHPCPVSGRSGKKTIIWERETLLLWTLIVRMTIIHIYSCNVLCSKTFSQWKWEIVLLFKETQFDEWKKQKTLQ